VLYLHLAQHLPCMLTPVPRSASPLISLMCSVQASLLLSSLRRIASTIVKHYTSGRRLGAPSTASYCTNTNTFVHSGTSISPFHLTIPNHCPPAGSSSCNTHPAQSHFPCCTHAVFPNMAPLLNGLHLLYFGIGASALAVNRKWPAI
jgi:hypothetical protein